jgi:hypothetical protein
MTEWKFVGIVVADSPISLNGLNPWDYKWIALDEPRVVVPHPSYPQQRHEFNVYQITDGKQTVRFAAGEYSNCVYGFFLRDAEIKGR